MSPMCTVRPDTTLSAMQLRVKLHLNSTRECLQNKMGSWLVKAESSRLVVVLPEDRKTWSEDIRRDLVESQQ